MDKVYITYICVGLIKNNETPETTVLISVLVNHWGLLKSVMKRKNYFCPNTHFT